MVNLACLSNSCGQYMHKLNRTDTLNSSKEENILVLLKYQDSFIEYAIIESDSFLVWAQNFNTIDCEFPYQSLFKQ